MAKTVLHLFHADRASMKSVPALAERVRSASEGALEIYVFGPAEQMLANPEQVDFNAQIDALVKAGVQVTTCIGIAQQINVAATVHGRNLELESATTTFPRFASKGANVISFLR